MSSKTVIPRSLIRHIISGAVSRKFTKFYFCAALVLAVFASCARASNGASTAAHSAVPAQKFLPIGAVCISKKNDDGCEAIHSNVSSHPSEARARAFHAGAAQEVRAHRACCVRHFRTANAALDDPDSIASRNNSRRGDDVAPPGGGSRSRALVRAACLSSRIESPFMIQLYAQFSSGAEGPRTRARASTNQSERNLRHTDP